MIRVIYRWRVQEGAASKFKAAWAKATTAIRAEAPGARGSFLLQSHQDDTEYLTIARWDRLEDWHAFQEDKMKAQMLEMHTFAQRLSTDVYAEIEDHTI